MSKYRIIDSIIWSFRTIKALMQRSGEAFVIDFSSANQKLPTKTSIEMIKTVVARKQGFQ